ncbi:MAG: DEAD/DEAH box helicase family protein [Blautia sp.]|nr:DEAD/DEAH box helicase family protein [Blautia sp.]
MLNRFSSRKTDLGKQYLAEHLQGAVSYDRIAGYFCSSVLEIAGEAMEQIPGRIRIICNSGLSPEDVKIAGLAASQIKQEWCAFKPEEAYTSPAESQRLHRLYDLLSTGRMDIRVLPDDVYGLMHGKAGVITYEDGRRLAFIGSMNETKSALTTNYEIVWEDDSDESVEWVQNEFDYFWDHSCAVPLSDFVISDIKRIANRHPMTLKGWREEGHADVAAVAAEEPVYRNEFGLWAHQKYFVMRAFEEHKSKGGARLVLADMVGLGKTLQLAMSAKLMGLYGDKPILIIVPKTLLYQWQDEIYTMLDIPSAVWTGRCWRDENGFDYVCDSVRGILKCPRKIGIVSQGIITAKTEAAELLKQLKYECVILDEAHRARRKNIGKDANAHKAQPNNLLRFLDEITFQTHSMLLATATPVQIDPIEAFDLLDALGRPKDASKVIGDAYSVWRKTPQTGLNYISGAEAPPQKTAEMWSIVRNPFPPRMEKSRRIGTLRDQMDISDDMAVLPQDKFDEMRRPMQTKIWELYQDEEFVLHYNPYVRCIVRRTRDFLENTINKETGEPYLKKINVLLLGEKDNEALELSGYLKQAYLIAEEFCHLLASRVKGGGFMSTLMLKRIGSTMIAGENTAKKMLAWTQEGKETLQEMYDNLTDEDDEDNNSEEVGTSEIKNLTTEELECLARLVNVLKSNRDTDPKYLRVLDILKNGVEDEGGWSEKGCIIFSQYYDSANYVAALLSREFVEEDIGLYAGGDKSGVYRDGIFTKYAKDELKAKVKDRKMKILVGTDAASEGLNLQALQTLINIDLPWNPTRLEQRKGRIQRIGQLADTILIYNMRYKDSVEDKVHTKLSSRLQEIYAMFGQIPEVLEDVWVAMAQNDEQRAMEAINKVPKKNPFIIKYEMEIPDCGDWEKCEAVLDKKEKIKELMKGW